MAVRIASWNVARGLSDERRHEKIEKGIEELDADVVILPEAFDQTGEMLNPDFARRLGYTAVHSVEYEDGEPHPSNRQYILALGRCSIAGSTIRLAERNALDLCLPTEEIRIVGAHFDDRNEWRRQDMAHALLEQMPADEPLILAGDLNATYGRGVSRILKAKSAKWLAERMPQPRIKSLATRLHEMADGGTMNILKQNGFVDADPKQRPTMLFLGSIPLVQLDHLLSTPETLVSKDFSLHSLDGSDHRAISAVYTKK